MEILVEVNPVTAGLEIVRAPWRRRLRVGVCVQAWSAPLWRLCALQLSDMLSNAA